MLFAPKLAVDISVDMRMVPTVILFAPKLAVEISIDARIVPEVMFVPVKSVTLVKPVDKSALPVTRIVPVVIPVV